MIEAVKASRFSVAIDYLVLGKEPAPGVPPIRVVVPADKTTLSAPKLKRNWEVRPGYGVDGAFCAFTGEGLATFDATFEFWSPEKEVRWKGFAGVYLATPAKSQTLSIYHPVLMMPPLRITSVVVTEIEGWSLVSPGRWQTRLSFLEYRPQKTFVPVKAEPAIPAATASTPARPVTEQELRVQASQARLRAAVDAGRR